MDGQPASTEGTPLTQEAIDVVAKKVTDEGVPLDQAQVEAAVEKAAEFVDPLDTKDVQIAAGQYAQNVKRIRAIAKNMKAGGLARVLIAEQEFPYAEDYPKLKGVEQELFVLMISNNQSKSIIAAALNEREEELKNQAAHNETTKILKKGGL